MAGARRAPPQRGGIAGSSAPCRLAVSSGSANGRLSKSDAARDGASIGADAFRGFRRGRLLLWSASTLSVLAGVALHDRAVRSTAAHMLWLGAVALTVGAPLHRLLDFRCPRCGAVYLSTGRWYDFLGIGRVLWSQRCGHCALPAHQPSAPHPPESDSP